MLRVVSLAVHAGQPIHVGRRIHLPLASLHPSTLREVIARERDTYHKTQREPRPSRNAMRAPIATCIPPPPRNLSASFPIIHSFIHSFIHSYSTTSTNLQSNIISVTHLPMCELTIMTLRRHTFISLQLIREFCKCYSTLALCFVACNP